MAKIKEIKINSITYGNRDWKEVAIKCAKILIKEGLSKQNLSTNN